MTIYPTKICNKCKKEKSLDEFNKVKSGKDGLRSKCKDCDKAINAAWRKANPESGKATSVAWRKANPKKKKASGKKYRQDNPGLERTRKKKYRQDNPDKVNAYCAQRRATKLQRTPSWADKKAILEVYRQASVLQELTGIPFHVDHTVPL